MSLVSSLKAVSLSTGLYRPARWLSRRLRNGDLQEFASDVQFYRDLLPPDSLVFDVGANIGEKSEALLAAGHRVVAFEPNPLVLAELYARCVSHRLWQVVETALGAEAAIMTMFARAASGQSGMIAEWEGDIVESFNVPVVTLDAAISQFGVPNYVKIDVEGWELEVLKGLTQAVGLVSLEFHLKSTDVAKTRACLERLLTLAPNARVNIAPAERNALLFSEWQPLRELAAWFPGDLARILTERSYGDLYVRS